MQNILNVLFYDFKALYRLLVFRLQLAFLDSGTCRYCWLCSIKMVVFKNVSTSSCIVLQNSEENVNRIIPETNRKIKNFSHIRKVKWELSTSLAEFCSEILSAFTSHTQWIQVHHPLLYPGICPLLPRSTGIKSNVIRNVNRRLHRTETEVILLYILHILCVSYEDNKLKIIIICIIHLDPGPLLRHSSFTAVMKENQVSFMFIPRPTAFVI